MRPLPGGVAVRIHSQFTSGGDRPEIFFGAIDAGIGEFAPAPRARLINRPFTFDCIPVHGRIAVTE